MSVDIPVKQIPRLNTGTFEVMPDSISVGEESNVMFGINNTGKVTLYNVMARFEADSIQTTDTYVGNIKSGETGNVDCMVTGSAPTTDDGKVKVIISYEDENGEVSEVEKELTLYVSEPAPDMDDMDMSGMDAPGRAGTGAEVRKNHSGGCGDRGGGCGHHGIPEAPETEKRRGPAGKRRRSE